MNLFIFLSLLTFQTLAMDQIILDKHDPGDYSRREYAIEMLKLSLEKTIKRYGPYKITYSRRMTRNRALVELESGKISVYDAPTRQEWENRTIPIYIPLTKGLLSYRLLLITKANQFKFSNIKKIEDLQKLRAGLSSQWSTTKLLNSIGGFNIIEGNSYSTLFSMLAVDRFDYFIRGVNEIFGELDNIKNKFPEIIIDDKILLHIPMPMYFFVSKKFPLLAKRIEEGLLAAIDDGSFDRMFYKYHKENIIRAKLKNRTLFNIETPNISKNKKNTSSKFLLNLETLKAIK